MTDKEAVTGSEHVYKGTRLGLTVSQSGMEIKLHGNPTCRGSGILEGVGAPPHVATLHF